MGLLIRLFINAVALAVAVKILPGMHYTGGLGGLLAMALIFGVVNALIRPILTVLTCPLVVMTLGLFTLVINALMLWLAGSIGRSLGIDFRIDSFWTAILGGIVISIVSVVLTMFIREEQG